LARQGEGPTRSAGQPFHEALADVVCVGLVEESSGNLTWRGANFVPLILEEPVDLFDLASRVADIELMTRHTSTLRNSPIESAEILMYCSRSTPSRS
jgi:hypothetical protein